VPPGSLNEESHVAQPMATFDGVELSPTVVSKAVA
jgi:hypothetical protein